jgi:hypothetical protein
LLYKPLVSETTLTSEVKYDTNWGRAFDVAAIGEARSAVFGNYSKVLSGTSVATPYVSGLASLLFGKHIHIGPAMVKKRILYTVDLSPDLDAIVRWGFVNFDRALRTQSDQIVIDTSQCDTPPNCSIYRRVDRKKTGPLKFKQPRMADVPFEQVRRLARMPGGGEKFWLIVENEGVLEKFVNVEFDGVPRLIFQDALSPTEKSLASIDQFTSAMELN